MRDPLARFSPWFYAAAAYNTTWGSLVVFAPERVAAVLGVELADAPLLQAIGMLVLVYAPAYVWAARHPSRHVHLVAVALLGKVLGPVGFVASVATGALPLSFGLTILTNDVVWWPAFAAYLRAAARHAGGWRAVAAG